MDSSIKYARLDDLFLDPLNPRLGRLHTGPKVTQAAILELMRDWALEELAVSFIESGYWPQEALIVCKESLYGSQKLVVIEGNRRLAALKFLQATIKKTEKSRKWTELIKASTPLNSLFAKIPYIEIADRTEVESFLGFRHVTGIKEWKPAEKAEFIARLIEKRSLSYSDVMRKIGSKTPTVRQNYIAYRLLLQMEETDGIDVEFVEDKFSVLFLSLRTTGVQSYLSIDITTDPKGAKIPVPKSKLKALRHFALWLFGDANKPPMVRDSRQVDDFGRILESGKAIEYLERTDRPNFDIAYQLAGGDEPELIRLLQKAADNVELALGKAHRFAKRKAVRKAASRLGTDTWQLLSIFGGLRDEIQESVQ